MNYDSVLNGSAMAGQCREMASRLKQEIDFYSFEIAAINTFIESKASGEAATALKNKAEKLIQMLQIVISANEYDIHDCNILAEMVDGITIDGYEVLTRKQEARNNAEECCNQAAYYSRVASECIISSIGNHFYELANTYRGYATSWERIEEALHKIENQYDDIDCTSSTLFKDGYETRCLLDNEEYDVVLLDCPIPAGVTKGGNTTAKDSDTEILNKDELSDEVLMTKYWFLYEHLKKLMNPSADDEEIFDAMRNINDKMPLVNFWATYHFSQNDYHKLVDMLDRDYFVKEQIDVLNVYLEINNLDWTDDEKQIVLEEYYKKYAPKDDYDYSMFAAGAELIIGKDVFIVEWDKCKEIYERIMHNAPNEYVIGKYAYLRKYIDGIIKTYEKHKCIDGLYIVDNNGQTIGYGHDLRPGENYGVGITEDEAFALLLSDLDEKMDIIYDYQRLLNDKWGYSIDVKQFSDDERMFLVDFTYNRGIGLADRTDLQERGEPFSSLALLLIAVNEKDYKSIEKILKEETLDLNGNYMLGLERRRMDEYEILINGEYNRDEDDNRKVWQY